MIYIFILLSFYKTLDLKTVKSTSVLAKTYAKKLEDNALEETRVGVFIFFF